MTGSHHSLAGDVRATARRTLFPAVVLVWRSFFALAGYALRPATRVLVPTGADRVLVLAPHPDDETVGCGGAIALHARSGDHVTVLIVTDGGQSRAGGLPGSEMTALRRLEARRAVALLGGITLVQLQIPEGAWRDEQLEAQLASALARMRPTIVYTTSIIDYHPAHVRVAHCLARALSSSEDRDEVAIRLYEVQVPLTPILANLVADVTAVSVRKSRALEAYDTQKTSLGWLPRYVSYQQRLYRTSANVEVFCQISAGRFVALAHYARAGRNSFRGIRPRPLTDIAAWLVGTRTRLRLRKVIRRSSD